MKVHSFTIQVLLLASSWNSVMSKKERARGSVQPPAPRKLQKKEPEPTLTPSPSPSSMWPSVAPTPESICPLNTYIEERCDKGRTFIQYYKFVDEEGNNIEKNFNQAQALPSNYDPTGLLYFPCILANPAEVLLEFPYLEENYSPAGRAWVGAYSPTGEDWENIDNSEFTADAPMPEGKGGLAIKANGELVAVLLGNTLPGAYYKCCVDSCYSWW